MNNKLKRYFSFLCAILISFGIISQIIYIPATAEEKNFSHSAYTFEYENLLLDSGDGKYPLLSKDGDYDTASGRGGGKASSGGAKIDPSLFSNNNEFTLSFWSVFSDNGIDDSDHPYSDALDLILSLQKELSSLDSSKYTDASYENFAKAIGELQDSYDIHESEEKIVSKIEKALSAKDSLVYVYSKPEASEVLAEAESLDLSVYTKASSGVFSKKLSNLAWAVSENPQNISSATHELLEAKENLEFIEYIEEAKRAYQSFSQKFDALITPIYTSDSVNAVKNAISELSASIEKNDPDSVLSSKIESVESAFSSLKAAKVSVFSHEIFAAYSSNSERYIKITQVDSSVVLDTSFGASSNSITCSVSDYIGKSEFVMVTYTFKKDSSGKLLVSVYINGSEKAKKTVTGNISDFPCEKAEFNSDVIVDDIYIATKAVSSSDCKVLYEKPMEEFLLHMDPSWVKPSDRISVNPVSNFKWSAYTFDNGFKIDSDLNGVASCSYNAIKLAPVDTSAYGGSFGMGLSRRKGIYPSYYLSLERGLLYSADSFTVAGYVYNPGGGTTTASFFEFSGQGGKLVFSPFSSDSSGQANAFFEYADKSGASQKVSFPSGRLGNISSKWTHFAFLFASNGDVTVYVDGKSAATVNTGLKLSELSLSSFKIISGITSGEAARIIIDDIYISSKVMSDSDIRKIAYYGAERFVGEVLPDPETGEVDIKDNEIDLSADETDALEDEYSDTAAMNGYIGTTFDDSSFMGEDYNGSVSAAIRNASLIQGQYKYGLNLNGKNAYLRYPIGVFDSISEITVSIAYNWVTPSSIGERNQKLFFFSNKDSSVSDPNTYMYLDMGNGTGGMKFCISDGKSSTEIPMNINNTGEWKRITVSIKDGNIKVYLDTDLVAQKKTDVDFTQISPNFNYIGKSGYKGDPLFCGVVDEIYISDREISVEEIGELMSGISPSVENGNNDENKSGDIWDGILIGTIVFMGLLLAAFIGFIVYILFFKK